MPFRIGLGAALVLVVAYLTVLKPKDEVSPPPAAPGVTGLSTAVGKAHGAAAASDAANAAVQAATGATTAAPGTAAPSAGATPAPTAEPAAKPNAAKTALADVAEGDRSKPILSELAAGKTAIVYFSSFSGSDDRHVVRILSRVDRHHGAVKVHRIAIQDVGDYDAITRGVQITQSPTLLVMGESLKARRIVGVTSRAEVEQLVNDVSGLRVTSKPSSYERLVEGGCRTTVYNIKGDRKSLFDFLGRGGEVDAVRDDIRDLRARLRGATVPKGFASFHASYVRYLGELDHMIGSIAHHVPRERTQAEWKRFLSRMHQMDDLATSAGLSCAV